MFWNHDFSSTTPTHIDVLLQMPAIKLSDILFEEDLLLELKTSNENLINFLAKPETIAELLDNIVCLTEKDCCDKSLFSRVHAAYISCEILTAGSMEIFNALINHPESLNKIITCLIDSDAETPDTVKVVPHKATLVQKLINSIHSTAVANLSCYITQDITSFSKLIDVLVNSVEVSGSFDLLSTFINRTQPHETRYVFCEILSKLNFVDNLINVMTLSSNEDKQRNACQLLCDIIVIGRQEAFEQTDPGPVPQDMLSEYLESAKAFRLILDQMFRKKDDNINSTAIVCGMKVLRTLIEQKTISDAANLQVIKAIEQVRGEIEKYLKDFHELLLNPPKQEPIKTTFGIIQKPLGYMRLEVVNLIRALIGTNSKNIVGKLVELKTMKTIIDLFIEYSWNNLLHTQVEQALCLVIKNCRHDEDLNDQVGMQQPNELISEPEKQEKDAEKKEEEPTNELEKDSEPTTETMIESQEKLQNGPKDDSEPKKRSIDEKPEEKPNDSSDIKTEAKITLEKDDNTPDFPLSELNSNEAKPEERELNVTLKPTSGSAEVETSADGTSAKGEETTAKPEAHEDEDDQVDELECKEVIMSLIESQQDDTGLKSQDESEKSPKEQDTIKKEIEIPSKALLSQLLNECDLIGRLLLPSSSDKANFGHIIQIINSIAINRDLETIRDHLDEMKEKRPDLHDRWTTFVNDDVASFKEISLYYDTQSANSNVTDRFHHNDRQSLNHQPGQLHHQQQQHQQQLQSSHEQHNNQVPGVHDKLMHNNSTQENLNNPTTNGDDAYMAYFSFTRETVIPTINVDVLPKIRRSNNVHQQK